MAILADGRKLEELDSSQIIELYIESLTKKIQLSHDINDIKDEILERMGE